MAGLERDLCRADDVGGRAGTGARRRRRPTCRNPARGGKSSATRHRRVPGRSISTRSSSTTRSAAAHPRGSTPRSSRRSPATSASTASSSSPTRRSPSASRCRSGCPAAAGALAAVGLSRPDATEIRRQASRPRIGRPADNPSSQCRARANGTLRRGHVERDARKLGFLLDLRCEGGGGRRVVNLSYVRTVSIRYTAPAMKRMFGAHAASAAGSTAVDPTARKNAVRKK